MEEKKELGGIPASSGSKLTPTAKPTAAPAAPAPKAKPAPTTAAAPVGPKQLPPQLKPVGTPNAPTAKDPKSLLRQKILNTIVQRRVGETKQSIYKQLGVQNEQELNSLLEKVKGYDELNGKFYAINTELSTLKAEKVASASGVRAEKVDDLLTYLKGKGLDYTAENIQQAAQGHPEWLVNQAQEVVKPATIGKVGQQQQPTVSDVEKARQLFPSLRTNKK
jgi:hypothetical protein